MLSKISKAKTEMKRVTGREPSHQELAHYLEMPVEKLDHYLNSNRNVISLEDPLRKHGNQMKDDTRTLGDTIASDAPTPLEDAQQVSLQQELRQVMEDCLAPIERQVLEARYGLDDGNPKSTQETSQLLELSRERVRLLEARALNKLRHPQRNYRLKTYIGDSDHEPGNFHSTNGRRNPVMSTAKTASKHGDHGNQRQPAFTASNPFASATPSTSPFAGFTGTPTSNRGNFHDYESGVTEASSTERIHPGQGDREHTEALSERLWFF